MVVNEKADRQHAIASALELPSTWVGLWGVEVISAKMCSKCFGLICRGML